MVKTNITRNILILLVVVFGLWVVFSNLNNVKSASLPTGG